jgi:hypothetical protein
VHVAIRKPDDVSRAELTLGRISSGQSRYDRARIAL